MGTRTGIRRSEAEAARSCSPPVTGRWTRAKVVATAERLGLRFSEPEQDDDETDAVFKKRALAVRTRQSKTVQNRYEECSVSGVWHQPGLQTLPDFFLKLYFFFRLTAVRKSCTDCTGTSFAPLL